MQKKNKKSKTKLKPICLSTPVTTHMYVQMTAYNCSTQYNTEQFW